MSLPLDLATDPAAPAFRVSFTPSFGESYRGARAVADAVPLARRLRNAAAVLLALGIGTLVPSVVLPGLRWLWSVAWLLLFLPMVVFPVQAFVAAWATWASRRGGGAASREHRFRFGDAGIEADVGGVTSFTRWEAVVRVAESERFVMYFTSDQCGQFIPRSALLVPAEADALATYLRARAGRPSSVPAPAAGTLAGAARVRSRFEIEPEELARASKAVARRGGQTWQVYLFLLVVVSLLSGPALVRELRAGGLAGVRIGTIVNLLLPFAFTALMGSFATRWVARRQVRTGPASRGVQEVSVHDDGIAMRGALHDGAFRWATLRSVEEDAEFFLFLLSSVSGLYLPKRTLSPGDVALVRQLARAGVGARARLLGDAPAS